MSKQRSSFSGGLGFVLAAAGSAVGLGNLWRFPYLAAKYGGGIFILVYIIFAVTFGFALLITEIAIGRKTQVSPLIAYKKLNKKFSFLGYLAVFVPVIIAPYYNVIGGWVTKYMVLYAENLFTPVVSDTSFGDFISSPVEPIVYFIIFLLASVLIILLGVEKGIEKLSKFMMPILVVIIVAISIYVLTLPNAFSGLSYYLVPDIKNFSFMTVVAAIGQLFYSMSIAMGIMITYGSYTKREVNLSKSVNQIEIFDTVVALLAGLMIVPAVYMFSGEEGLSSSGPGLMFDTLPKVFEQMPAGNIVGLLFFVLVLFAALTSSISIMEALASSFMDKFNIKRKTACIIIVALCLLMGIPSSLGNGVWSNIKLLGMDFLSFFDYISNNIFMPIVAFFTCILVGWVIKPKFIIDEVTRNGEKFGRKGLFTVMIKYVAPVCLIIIFASSVLEKLGIISI